MQASPFVPFVIHTADGKSYEVPHPDHVSVHFKLGKVEVSRDDDSYVIISDLLITAVETKAGAKAIPQPVQKVE